MSKLALCKKIAAFLLAICFVLPLSKCTSTVAPPNTSASAQATDAAPHVTVTYHYGYKAAYNIWSDFKKGNIWDGVISLLALFNVFFLPLVALKLKEKWQAPLYFLCSFPAAYMLNIMVFFGSEPMYGGILTIACWVVLFCVSTFTIVRMLLEKLKSRGAAPA